MEIFSNKTHPDARSTTIALRGKWYGNISHGGA